MSPVVTGRGGYRPNGGRKAQHKSATKDTATAELTDYQRLERARADKEHQLARKAKLEADLSEGEQVLRESVRDAAAAAYSTCAQALFAIPDMLERRMGVAVDVTEAVRKAIYEATEGLSEELKRIHDRHL